MTGCVDIIYYSKNNFLTVSKKGVSNLLISRIEINIIVIKFGGGYKQILEQIVILVIAKYRRSNKNNTICLGVIS
jgi:hypothetical protein